MKKIAILIPLLILSACTTSNFTKTGFAAARAPLAESCSVTVLEQPPTDRGYEELGFCLASTPGGGMITDKTPAAIEELKKCACKAGGNAIWLKSNGESGVHTGLGYSQQHVKVQGTVLWVKAPGEK